MTGVGALSEVAKRNLIAAMGTPEARLRLRVLLLEERLARAEKKIAALADTDAPRASAD